MDQTKKRPVFICAVLICLTVYILFVRTLENDARYVDPPFKRAAMKKHPGGGVKQSQHSNRPADTSKPKTKRPYNPFDILHVPLIKFDKKYKNPCWYGNATNGPTNDGIFHCLPYFFILGVKKSGTTDLYTRISRHPEYQYPGFKESHWLTEIRFGFKVGKRPFKSVSTKNKMTLDKSSVKFYIAMYDKAADRIKSEKSKVTKGPRFRKITGDANPAHFFKHRYWQKMPGNVGRTEPKYTNFHYLKHLVPNAKIVLIFRDPVSRMLSDFKHGLRLKGVKMDEASVQQLFHDNSVILIRAYQDCFQEYSMRRCIYNFTLPRQLKKRGVYLSDSFRNGFYEFFMKELSQVFDHDHILPVLMTDYMTDMKGTLRKVFDFLKMRQLSSSEWDPVLRMAISNGAGESIGMLPKTKRLLTDFYLPFNKQMAEFMGDKRYLFNESD